MDHATDGHSLHEGSRIAQLEMSLETLDKRLDRIMLEFRDLKHLAGEAATKKDIVALGRRLRWSLLGWCVALALGVWYLAAGAAGLVPLMQLWPG